MPLVLADRVRDTTTTTGTGTVTLSGTAPSGYQNFSVVGNGNTTYYTINAGSQWEVGIGTYSSTGPTLARTTVLASSNSGSLVDFSAGTKDVFVTYPAGESVYQDGASIAAGTAVLGVANGGTGTSTAFTAGSVVFAGASGVYSQDNANLFWDNANDRLGIGTSIPGYRLTLIGTDTTNALISGVTRGVRFAFNSTTSRIEGVDNTGAASYQPLDINGSILTMSISATERMRITSAGSVGIGTSAPARLFEVTATGTNIPARLGNSQGNLDIGGSDGVVVNIDTRSWAMGLQTGGTERMRITTAGLVGIGTSAPAELLDVNAATTSTGYTDFVVFRQVNGAGTHSRILFGQNSTNNMFIEVANQANTKGNLLLQPFGGNVGVGTGSPAFNLDVTGTGRFTGLTQFDNDIILNKATLNYLYFNDALAFARNGVGERMRIDTSGNVGIGTSAPSMKLDVYGGSLGTTAGNTLDITDVRGATGNNTRLVTRLVRGSNGSDWTTAALRLQAVVDVTNQAYIDMIPAGATYGLAFGTGGGGAPVERMRIDSGGNVNIGASAATAAGGIRYLDIYNTENTSGASATDIRLITQNAAGSGTTTLDLIKYKSGAFYISNAETGSGGIIGFNTASTERARIDASGNFMVGTTSATGLLSVAGLVYGQMVATDRFGLLGNNLYYGSGNFRYVGNGHAYGWAQGNTDGADLRLLYAGNNTSGGGAVASPTERIYITAAGNVGIGTSSPDANAKLDVAGTIRSGVGGSDPGTGTALYFVGSGAFQSVLAGAAFAVHTGNNNARTERMRIDINGLVGIGTSSPGAKLDVTTASGANIVVSRSSAAGYAAFQRIAPAGQQTYDFYTINGTEAGRITVDGSNFMAFSTGSSATERMRIDGSGNVGIGTSSPAGRLDVVSTSAGGASFMRVANGSGVANSYAAISLDPGNNGFNTRDAQIRAINNGSNQISLTFLTSNAGTPFEAMRIDNVGNVGIGTASPDVRLSVQDAGAGQITLKDSGGTTRAYVMTNGAIGTAPTNALRLRGDAGIALGAVGSLAMFIDTSNNVGIGTTSPGAKLQINAQDGFRFDVEAGAASTMRFGSASTGEATAALAFTRTTGVISLSSGSTGSALNERMRIDGSGNVAIGTTTTASRLRVAAGAQINAPVLGNVTNYPAFLSGPDTGFGLGIGTNNVDGRTWLQAQRSDGNAATYPITLNEAGGNVGIGTTSPGATLGVVTNTTSHVGMRVTNNSTTQFAGSGLQMLGPSAAGTQGGAAIYYYNINVGGTQGAMAMAQLDSNGSFQRNLAYYDFSGQYWGFATNSNERVRINSSGEFLVGTSSGGRSLCLFGSDVWQRIHNASRSWLIGLGTGSNFVIYDETGGGPRLTVEPATGNWIGPNSIALGAGFNNDNRIEVGTGRTGNNYAYIDLIGDTTYTDYGLRLLRGNTGPNTGSELAHRGTGDLNITCYEAATMRFNVNGGTRMYIDSAGTSLFTGLIVGRTGLGSDVNSANDTGSFSVRGDTTKAASISFHRAGAYAMNMGLGTDAVFRIGGWSAVSNAFQMDGSGNLTMAGNVTAYSDARLKKDVETIDSALDLVSKMRGVRYTRIGTEKRGVGVIAQEMLEVVPEVVQQGVGDDDTLSVAYGNLVGVLIEAVKELTARVAELEGK